MVFFATIIVIFMHVIISECSEGQKFNLVTGSIFIKRLVSPVHCLLEIKFAIEVFR